MSDAARQTLSFLIRRFREVGIHPKSKFGQNFLIDMNLLQVLVDAAEIGPNDVVLEIGTGTGSLTAMMAPLAAHVITVEIDSQMYQMASEELHMFSNVTMLKLDALKSKTRLNPELLETVRRHLDVAPERRFKLVANLPYNVATPIISNLLASELPPERMTVTIQKELADRIVASHGTKDYGSFSLWVQCQCQAEIVRILPPTVFWPKPKVDSAFVRITLDRQRREQLPDRPFLHDFLRSLFMHRRKFLRAQLQINFKNRIDKNEIDALLSELGIDPTIRAEQLDLATVLRLADGVRKTLAGR